ncbi:hypothetical protein [Candidatus Mesenet endosymbiont of Agriotes lineatus]|uniref:hypothetical protein n=1 Tax=Candidatus Mesenet endosymbiont of Agriotes lineatus TaxID=3077948 RepID=UPI0030CFAA8C
MCLIDRRTFLNSKIKNSTDPKIMLIQLPFLISLSTSIFICLINAFILKYKNNRFVHASDLTAAELQLRGTVEDRSIIFDL